MTTTHKKIRVLVADDHPMARAGVAAMLATQEDVQVVAAAENGVEALSLCRQHAPDVVVLDMRMPGMDGLSVTRSLAQEPNRPRVLILSHYDGDDDVWSALKAGARGYLTKSARGEVLAEAIRALARGERYLPAELNSRVVGRMGQQELTFRERQVVELVFKGHSNKAIGTALSISERTVALHVSNMLAKLGARSRTEAVSLALARGLLKS